ncbi:MAG: HNH endonuclease signature motif containing protein [Aureibaculum sp.]|nr:HNH endonuclease signature motif containing protein [Aureibaculum sp.]
MKITDKTEIPYTDPILRKAMYEVFDGKCFYTGRNLSFEEMHIDHIKPKSKGGENCISNYVISCGYINIKKRAKYSDRFIEITQELVKIMFTQDVINTYKNIYINNSIIEGYEFLKHYISNNDFFKRPNVNHLEFVSYMYHSKEYIPIKIKPMRKNGEMAKRNDIYYKKEDIDKGFKYWSNKRV